MSVTRAPIEKTVHGEPVSQTAFRQAVFDAINLYPDGARAGDIQNELGDEWQTKDGRELMAATLNNLKRAGYLDLVEGQRGLFKTTKLATKGADQFERFERDVVKTIADEGGIITMRRLRDIYAPLGVARVRGFSQGKSRREQRHRVRKSLSDTMAMEQNKDKLAELKARAKRFDSSTSNIRRVVEKSQRIRQNNRRTGVYHVDYATLARIPQSGRNLSMMMSWVGRSAWKRDYAKDRHTPLTRTLWYDSLRIPFFQNLGVMVKALRETHGWSLSDVAADSGVSRALARMRGYANTTYQDARVSIKEEEIKHGGRQDYDPEPALIEETLLYWFEEGHEAMHMAVEPDLVAALAKLYYCDAAFLSLGVIMPEDTDEKVRAGKFGQDAP